MIDKTVYATTHYFFLMVFLLACWGAGRAMLRRLVPTAVLLEPDPMPLGHGIAAALGLGLYIGITQWLAISGQLRVLPLLIALALGLVLGLLEWRALPARSGPTLAQRWQRTNWTERGTLLLIALLVLPTIIAPLCPPLAWDEVMYHLPHAKQWALNGRLSVNEWLRYPWFPFNADLLFSAALLTYDDVMPHLLNALAAWLTAYLIYQAGKRLAGKGVASIAAAIFLWLTRNEFDNAMVDTLTTLFVFVGCLVFHLWQRQPQLRALLATSAFLLGVAVGMKYQALQVLPVFAIALLLRTRAPRNWLIAAAGLLVPCAYWYVRNYVLTGDPFNPIGGKLFGFSDWNLGDYQFQFEDIKRNAGWPSWIIWPALLAPFIGKVRRLPGAPAAMVLGGVAIVIWLLTSRYPRYLMPFYPILALLAAAVWQWLFETACKRFAREGESSLRGKAAATCVALGVLAVLPAAVKNSHKNWKLVAPTPAVREEILQHEITGYPVLAYLRDHPMGLTYQFGLEDSLYYAPLRTGGDHFGPGRYRDFQGLAPADLAKALQHAGYASLLIHAERWPGINTRPGFAKFFTLVYQDGPVSLYQIVQAAPPDKIPQ